MQFRKDVFAILVRAWMTALVLLSAALQGCAPPPEPIPPAPERPLTSFTEVPPLFVRLRGSSTVGANLAPRLAEAFLKSLGATEVGVRADDKHENMINVSGQVRGKYAMFQIHYPGTADGFEGLEAHECDAAMASRPIEDTEISKLKSEGDMTAPEAEHVIAMDGIAIVVHPSNRISELSVEQIGAIFRGEIRDWGNVGAAPGPIHRYVRDKRSGTYETFVHVALEGADIPLEGATVLDDGDSVAAAIARDPGGIGFVGLPSIGSTKAIAVQDGEAAPLAPSPLSISREEYPFARRLFFYLPEHGVSPFAKEFVTFALSDEGQRVVANAGFISLAAGAAGASAARRGAPEKYVKATAGMQRLSFNIHFRGKKLDARSMRDLERMARYIKVASSSHRDVSLFGFSDRQPSPAKSLELSQERADTVAAELRERGINPQLVEGLGDAMPIAPNGKARGRAKNQRVEVWLR